MLPRELLYSLLIPSAQYWSLLTILLLYSKHSQIRTCWPNIYVIWLGHDKIKMAADPQQIISNPLNWMGYLGGAQLSDISLVRHIMSFSPKIIFLLTTPIGEKSNSSLVWQKFWIKCPTAQLSDKYYFIRIINMDFPQNNSVLVLEFS